MLHRDVLNAGTTFMNAKNQGSASGEHVVAGDCRNGDELRYRVLKNSVFLKGCGVTDYRFY